MEEAVVFLFKIIQFILLFEIEREGKEAASLDDWKKKVKIWQKSGSFSEPRLWYWSIWHLCFVFHRYCKLDMSKTGPLTITPPSSWLAWSSLPDLSVNNSDPKPWSHPWLPSFTFCIPVPPPSKSSTSDLSHHPSYWSALHHHRFPSVFCH